MNKELKIVLDEYIEEFLNQEIVKKYFSLLKQIDNSQEIHDLENNLSLLQKELALSINKPTLHQENLIKYNQAKDKLYSHPLVNNFLLIKEEILNQINDLVSKIKEER